MVTYGLACGLLTQTPTPPLPSSLKATLPPLPILLKPTPHSSAIHHRHNPKVDLTFEQQPPKIKDTITSVCAHAGTVLWAIAESRVPQALERAPVEAVPSRCGRASIWLMVRSSIGGCWLRIEFERDEAELSITVDGEDIGGADEPLRRRVMFLAMVGWW